MTPALIHSLNYPIRRQILRLLSEPGVELSPARMARSMSVGLSTLSFHSKVLVQQGVTSCVRTDKVRGSTEHFYATNVAGNELVAMILRETEEDDGFLDEGSRRHRPHG